MMKRFLVVLMTIIMLATSAECVLATEVADTADELVIVLDPGHDATHAGAGGNGVREEKAVLKIALYLKEELSKYKNVKVYMTREGEACAFPDTVGASEGSKRCNEARVAYAASVGADVFVSLHLNSYTNSSPNGALAFVQNNNYSAEAGKISQELGRAIVNRLAELGLKNNGISMKDSDWDTKPEEYYYADGSIADYYRVLRYAKKVCLPALIVEHAFLSNASDANLVLKSEEGLKALALKDAAGIVDYYGLTLKEGCVAGELPDIQSVPETQTKPSPAPNTQTESQAPETETETQVSETEEIEETEVPETETEVPEETETQVPEETEEVENTEGVDTNTDTTKWKFPYEIVVVLGVIAFGIGGFLGYKNYMKK